MKKENLPNRKVAATGASGAIALIIVWIVGQFGFIVPPEIASAFTVLVGALAGYLTPEKISKVIDTVSEAGKDNS